MRVNIQALIVTIAVNNLNKFQYAAACVHDYRRAVFVVLVMVLKCHMMAEISSFAYFLTLFIMKITIIIKLRTKIK